MSLLDLELGRADAGRQVFQPAQLLLQRADPFSQGTESLQLRDRSVGVLNQSLEIGVLGLQPLSELAQLGKVLVGTAPAKITEKGGHQALLLDECAREWRGPADGPAGYSIVGRVTSARQTGGLR